MRAVAFVVPETGLEPVRPHEHQILSLTWLPVTPLWLRVLTTSHFENFSVAGSGYYKLTVSFLNSGHCLRRRGTVTPGKRALRTERPMANPGVGANDCSNER